MATEYLHVGFGNVRRTAHVDVRTGSIKFEQTRLHYTLSVLAPPSQTPPPNRRGPPILGARLTSLPPSLTGGTSPRPAGTVGGRQLQVAEHTNVGYRPDSVPTQSGSAARSCLDRLLLVGSERGNLLRCPFKDDIVLPLPIANEIRA